MEQAVLDRMFTPGQFEIVTVIVGEADRLGQEFLTAARTIASRAFIHVVDDRVAVNRV